MKEFEITIDGKTYIVRGYSFEQAHLEAMKIHRKEDGNIQPSGAGEVKKHNRL